LGGRFFSLRVAAAANGTAKGCGCLPPDGEGGGPPPCVCSIVVVSCCAAPGTAKKKSNRAPVILEKSIFLCVLFDFLSNFSLLFHFCSQNFVFVCRAVPQSQLPAAHPNTALQLVGAFFSNLVIFLDVVFFTFIYLFINMHKFR
jgi:hypothetical protein